MSDIVDRLRQAAAIRLYSVRIVMEEAADEIERLRAELETWQRVAADVRLVALALYAALDHLRHGCTPSCTDQCALPQADDALSAWEQINRLEER